MADIDKDTLENDRKLVNKTNAKKYVQENYAGGFEQLKHPCLTDPRKEEILRGDGYQSP